MNQLPTYLDRYPAKMVVRLADTLIEKYASPSSYLFDPFCGSGAILATGKKKQLRVSGADINPYAVLLSNVKLSGFDKAKAKKVCSEWIKKAKVTSNTFPVNWESSNYWFSTSTLNKYERLRYVAQDMHLNETLEGRSALLAYALSVRRCSRADQRSPKPFISKTAIKKRKGKHFSPFKEITFLFNKLSDLYGIPMEIESNVQLLDFVSNGNQINENNFTHIITSPPYINAQDYFRNFKLELYLLEDLLPFKISDLINNFIGTERGQLFNAVLENDRNTFRQYIPSLIEMDKTHPKSAAIIYKYLSDMSQCFDAIKRCLKNDGTFVIVCGDNLVSGYSIPTWQVLNCLLETRGFVLFDRFGDQIDRRALAPKRNGHKGLIKEETVSVFKLLK